MTWGCEEESRDGIEYTARVKWRRVKKKESRGKKETKGKGKNKGKLVGFGWLVYIPSLFLFYFILFVFVEKRKQRFFHSIKNKKNKKTKKISFFLANKERLSVKKSSVFLVFPWKKVTVFWFLLEKEEESGGERARFVTWRAMRIPAWRWC